MSMMRGVQIDIRDLETKFEAERASWETYRQQLAAQVADYENRLNQLTLENKRLARSAEDKYREIELWKAKYNESAL